jgi:quercetin dioxygenase-like cupin family protein
MRGSVIPVLALALVACGPETQEPPPPSTTVAPAPRAPEGARFVLDGEYVKAMVFELEPGQAQGTHEGPDRLVYALNDYTIEWKEGDAAPVEKSWTAGQVHWHQAGPHAAKNVGEEVARYLVVARTEMTLPAAAARPESAQADTEVGSVVFENERIQVVEVVLAPGEATPRHWGGPRMIYSLSDYTIRWTEGDAEPIEKAFEAGEAHYHEAAEHVVENTGETDAHYLVITFES